MKILSQLSLSSARKKGVSLIEMLVVTVIFSIIAVSLFLVFKASLDSWRRTQASLEVYQNARAAFDIMTRELSAAYLSPETSPSDPTPLNPSITFKGFPKGAGAAWQKNVSGDSIFFIAALNPSFNYSDAAFDLCKVGYYLDGNNNALMRYSHYVKNGSTPNWDFADQTGVTYAKIASNVTELSFRYKNSLNWDLTMWDSSNAARSDMYNQKPAKVQVTLKIKEPNSTRDQIFTTSICILQ